MREIFSHSIASVWRGIGLRMAENGGSYLFNSLAVAYATGVAAAATAATALPDTAQTKAMGKIQQIDDALDRVENLSEDRVLRHYLMLIMGRRD